ncbi:hypothetical protein [Noviherbaspirillum massiliense]|uniref:hypothetical protein n=1 Tax=Noviherbaspirillum massiliense TaxID=1465823 RepID=UPI00030A5E08|nr:hypothetical protein [Noviherbaspirillum massiliense]
MSAIFGNGKAYGKNVGSDTTVHWRAMDVRFGRDLSPSFFYPASLLSDREKLRADMVYYNEGHPNNNHRDGFAAQLVYANRFRRNLAVEFGIGPYLNMNTTTIDGREIDESHWGGLISAALRVGLDQYSPGLHLRIGINHAVVHDAHSSTALMAGIGKYFDAAPAYPDEGSGPHPFWLGVATGSSKTNQTMTDMTYGISLEGKRYWGQWAASVSALAEGDDGSRVNRYGIAAQGWYVQSLTDKWSVSAGVGPYLARNERASDDNFRVDGLLTFQAERLLSHSVKVYASFSRVQTFREKNDRDLFRIGVMKQFGG